MRVMPGLLLVGVLAFVFSNETWAQRLEICGEEWVYTDIPSSLNRQSFVIFGRVSFERPKGDQTVLKVVVRLRDGHSVKQRSFTGSGTYCFERSRGGSSGSSGEITVDINGEQVESRPLIPDQPEQREDFRIIDNSGQPSAPPGVVSAKFPYKRNGKNSKLVERALKAVEEQRADEAINDLTAVIKADPGDYVAAATLGSIHFHLKKYVDAEIWLKRAIEIKPDFTPAWMSLARTQYAQNNYETAIESGKKAIGLEPDSAVAFYIVGEIYLRTNKGDLAVGALNEAIRLDSFGMAECHLILADLYDLNGAKKLAAREYQAFLAKIPKHRDRQKIEQYIRDNPPE